MVKFGVIISDQKKILGRVGLVDFDTVEVSNLHRQVIHSSSRVGLSKVSFLFFSFLFFSFLFFSFLFFSFSF